MSSLRVLGAELLLLVLQQLHRSVHAVPYLLDLRRVNTQFNETILHVVFFLEQHKSDNIGHNPTCEITRSRCLDSQCKVLGSYGTPSSTYARLHVQARLNTKCSHDPRKVQLFNRLGQAGELLEKVIDEAPVCCNILKPQILAYQVISTNPVFSNTTHALVSHVLLYFLGSETILNVQQLHPEEIEEESPMFWVVAAALFCDSQALLDHLISPHIGNKRGWSSTEIQTAACKCLSIAVERGHYAMVKRILDTNPQAFFLCSSPRWSCPLRAAVRRCDFEMVRLLLAYKDRHPTKERVTIALARGSGLCSDPDLLKEVLIFLWPHTDRSLRLWQSTIVINAARCGSIEAIEYLISQNALDPFHVRFPNGQNAINGPAKYGHLDCLKVLLDGGYLRHGNKIYIEIAVKSAARIALQSNQVAIFLELQSRYNLFNRPLWFSVLAAADGTQDIMRAWMEQYPDMLNLSDGTGSHPENKPTIGQSALACALQHLRSSNAEFLLELGVRPSGTSNSIPQIPWRYFDRRRTAFKSTQAVLKKFELPSLRIEV